MDVEISFQGSFQIDVLLDGALKQSNVNLKTHFRKNTNQYFAIYLRKCCSVYNILSYSADFIDFDDSECNGKRKTKKSAGTNTG